MLKEIVIDAFFLSLSSKYAIDNGCVIDLDMADSALTVEDRLIKFALCPATRLVQTIGISLPMVVSSFSYGFIC
jgi:hypothetical protein